MWSPRYSPLCFVLQGVCTSFKFESTLSSTGHQCICTSSHKLLDFRSRNSKHASGFTDACVLGIFVHMNAFILGGCSIILILIFGVETALGRSHGPTVRSPIQTAWLQSPHFKIYSGRLTTAGKHVFSLGEEVSSHVMLFHQEKKATQR